MKTRILILTLMATIATHASPGNFCAARLGGDQSAIQKSEFREWQTKLEFFFNSENPQFQSIADVVQDISKIDTSIQDHKNDFASLGRKLNFFAKSAVAVPDFGMTAEQLNAQTQKVRLLNVPALRNLLSEALQVKVAKTIWVFNHANWNSSLTHSQKIEKIRLELSIGNSQVELKPLAKMGPDSKISVVEDDIMQVKADAILLTVGCNGYCGSGLHATLKEFIGNELENRKLKDGEVLVLTRRKSPSGQVRNFILVADDQKMSLSDLLEPALKAAEQNDFTSIAVPAIRTGDAFGAVESRYADIVNEMLYASTSALSKGHSNLKNVIIAIYKNHGLADRFEKELLKIQESRERSLRYDLREAKLSGKGFVMKPSSKPFPLDRSRSPIYETMLKPWDLKYMLTPHAPLPLGKVVNEKLFDQPVTSVLNMPIKMKGTEFRIPVEFEQFREFFQIMIDHEVAANPQLADFYAYLTVDHNFVKAGNSHRRAGVHIDGVQGARYPVKLYPEHTYSISNTLGTIFYDQSFDLTKLDPNTQHVHAEIERQVKVENKVTAQNYVAYLWDSYSAHEADVTPHDLYRTFIRIEFSQKIYDGVGDTQSPLFDYFWPRTARVIPSTLDDSPK